MRKLLMLCVIGSMLAACQHGDKPCSYYQEQLETPVYFRFGEAELTPKAQVSLDEGIEFLQKHRFRRIKIDAYADPLGTDEYNVDLTHRRAVAIRDYIMSKGIAEKRIQMQWHGTEEVAKDNYHEHRRVDISVL